MLLKRKELDQDGLEISPAPLKLSTETMEQCFQILRKTGLLPIILYPVNCSSVMLRPRHFWNTKSQKFTFHAQFPRKLLKDELQQKVGEKI